MEVERLGLEGEGIASHDGRALFIAGAFPGERVSVQPEVGGKVQRAQLRAVLAPSPRRRSPPCPLADRCGGCDWMQLEPSAQVEEKERLLLEALGRLGGLETRALRLLPTAGAGTDTGTRRRAVLHWESGALAYFGRRSHQAVPVEVCPALVPALASLPGRLSRALGSLGRSLGSVHLLAEGEAVSLGLALEGRVTEKARQAAGALVRAGVARGVVLLPQQGGAEEFGRPVLDGPAPLRPEVRLRYRPDAFAQAHVSRTELLVERALDLLQPGPTDRALELYAGSGTFTFALAARVGSVLAVESSPPSVALASGAARAARVENVRWVQGDAARVTEGLVKEGTRFDVLLADPPRTGAPELARQAVAVGVRRLVYVACDAGSAARDAARLVEAGFRLDAVQLVDLFPNTHHVEALLAFSSRGLAYSTRTIPK